MEAKIKIIDGRIDRVESVINTHGVKLAEIVSTVNNIKDDVNTISTCGIPTCILHEHDINMMKENQESLSKDVKEIHDMIIKNGFLKTIYQTSVRTTINTWLISITLAGFLGAAFYIIRQHLIQ